MVYAPKEKISIIIAAYNEQFNIGNTIERTKMVMPEAEIVVVDDGSVDDTFQNARKYESRLVKVIRCPENKGKGHAIKTGIVNATGEVMAQIDADLQFPVEGLPDIIQPIIDKKADITFGTRYLKGTGIEEGSLTFLKRAASFLMGWLITLITGQRYTDVFAGFKAWRADVIRDIDLEDDGFTYEAEIAIKAKKMRYRVIEVHTAYRKRTSGQSKIRILFHTAIITLQIFRLAFFKKVKDRGLPDML